jgi:nuclear pore complex protein Nup133
MTQSTFVSPDAVPEVVPEAQEVHKNDAPPPKLEIKRDTAETLFVPRKDQTIRTKKPKAGERASKGDGSVVLVSSPLSKCYSNTS